MWSTNKRGKLSLFIEYEGEHFYTVPMVLCGAVGINFVTFRGVVGHEF